MDQFEKRRNPPLYNQINDFSSVPSAPQFEESEYPHQNVPVRLQPDIHVLRIPPPQQIPQIPQLAAVVNVQMIGQQCNHDFSIKFTCCGIFLAIIVPPVGFLLCFLLSKRRCDKCGFCK